jgi:DNA polymerase III epsilon subunit-like protein
MKKEVDITVRPFRNVESFIPSRRRAKAKLLGLLPKTRPARFESPGLDALANFSQVDPAYKFGDSRMASDTHENAPTRLINVGGLQIAY